MSRGVALGLALAAAALAGAPPAIPQDTPKPAPPAKSKPLSKAQQRDFAKDLGFWLLMGDEPKLADSERRAKHLADLKKLEGASWKGVRKTWNGWIPGTIPFDRKGRCELTYRYDPAVFTKNEIYFAEAAGYQPGRPTPLVVALHGGGRGVGGGSQAMGYGQPFAGKGCFVIAPTVPGNYVFAQPPSERFVRYFIHELAREVSLDFDRCYCVGHSLGGVGAWAFAARMPDYWAATVSGAGNPPGIVDDDFEYLFNTPLWVHHGVNDIQVKPDLNKKAEAAIALIKPPLRDVTFHWYTATDGRGHVYGPEIPKQYEPWVMEHVRDMYPKRVVAMCPIARGKDEQGNVDYDGSETEVDVFWIGIRGCSGTAKVVAELKGPDRIEVTARGATNVVIYVSDEFLDLDKPVVVVVNGQEKHNAVVPRSAEFLCKHIERTDDRGRFFSNEIVIPASQ